MTLEIVHQQDRSRFAALDDGAEVGELTYVEQPGQVVIEHTIVDPSHQGEGIAAKLAETALTELGRASEARIVPECSYVAQYVRKHPEYAPLTER